MWIHFKDVISCSQNEFEDMWKLYDTIPPTQNPMNKKTFIKRKQITFGSYYSFGRQKSLEYTGDYPTLVKRVLEHIDDERYNVVHTNFYDGGEAGLAPHSDDETQMLQDMPIYSFTFLSEPGNPRGFQIYEKQNKKLITTLMLDHGDMLKMKPGMQQKYMHGVKKTAAKKFANLRRINMTVRAWK